MVKSSELEFFNELYAKNRAGFVRFANSYVRDMSLAEDIATEGFVTYWENRHSIPEGSNIQAYIITIIKNKCLNYLMHSEVKSKTLSKMQDNAQWELNLRISTLEACDPESLFSTEIKEIINKTLAQLPEKTFEVFSMSRYKNKSHKEIAQILNISTKGVEFHISKALNKLRESLKDYLFTIILLFFL